jgi:prolipoprotein diacylglyceryltransferase
MLTPRLTVRLFRWKISAFHFYGVMGFIVGSVLGACIAYVLQLSVATVLLLSVTGAAVFFALAIGAKVITGEETIVYYHHEIAILIMCAIVLGVMHEPVLAYLDITILGVATFLAFGRIGCFSVGCCHGKPARKGVCYGHDHVAAGFTFYYEDIPLFPIQLVESVFVFVVILAGTVLMLRHSTPGTVLILYTAVYGTFRFAVEFFRGDAERPYLKGLSEAQWTTLLLIAVSLVFSFTGLVPFYVWHIGFSLLLFIAGIIVVARSSPERDMINPVHIRQIAAALNSNDDHTSPASPTKVNLFQTGLGLEFSKGQVVEGDSLIKHYTVSCPAPSLLNEESVKKIAIVIQQLQKHQSAFEIRKKQNAIFHILFKE